MGGSDACSECEERERGAAVQLDSRSTHSQLLGALKRGFFISARCHDVIKFHKITSCLCELGAENRLKTSALLS